MATVHCLIKRLQDCAHHDQGGSVIVFFFFHCFVLFSSVSCCCWCAMIYLCGTSSSLLIYWTIKSLLAEEWGLRPAFTGPSSPISRVSAPEKWEVTGSIPVHDIQKLLKWNSLGSQTYGVELGIMWLGVVSSQVSGAWYFSEVAL